MTTTRAEAEGLDATDPLRDWRDLFFVPDPDTIYVDGNSLGRMPVEALAAADVTIREGWGTGLVTSWDDWIEVSRSIGDTIASELVGARAGEVIVSDSTSVNLYKLASAATSSVMTGGRSVIVLDREDFPTDRYILQGLAAASDMELRYVDSNAVLGPQPHDIAEVLSKDVALVVLSHVHYRSGALAQMAEITRLSHEAGALVLWDLSHSVGAIPIALNDCDVDVAVGCTYKYLNGGPGAPAFLYIREDLQAKLQQPIWGWFGHRDQFTFANAYEPALGIESFLVGTPPILSMKVAQVGIEMIAECGLRQLRAKSAAMSDFAIQLADECLSDLGFEVATPRDAGARGSHVSLKHDDAYRISVALKLYARVIPDFREPNIIRLGLPPIYTRYADVYEAITRIASTVKAGQHLGLTADRARVT